MDVVNTFHLSKSNKVLKVNFINRIILLVLLLRINGKTTSCGLNTIEEVWILNWFYVLKQFVPFVKCVTQHTLLQDFIVERLQKYGKFYSHNAMDDRSKKMETPSSRFTLPIRRKSTFNFKCQSRRKTCFLRKDIKSQFHFKHTT